MIEILDSIYGGLIPAVAVVTTYAAVGAYFRNHNRKELEGKIKKLDDYCKKELKGAVIETVGSGLQDGSIDVTVSPNVISADIEKSIEEIVVERFGDYYTIKEIDEILESYPDDSEIAEKLEGYTKKRTKKAV